VFAPMFDFVDDSLGIASPPLWQGAPNAVPFDSDWSKIAFDGIVAFLLLPALGLVALALIVLNPFLNPGPLLYRQSRMGQGGAPFTALKFRTMSAANGVARGAFDKLETDRISRFTRVLRKMRIDELPQVINVLRGEMSLIGPRPDLYDHACVYAETIPGYAERYAVVPGITGYAQVAVGYVDGLDGVHDKVAADHVYLRKASLRFDLWIAWRTIWVILGRQGS